MKMIANLIRPGQILEHNGALWRVMKADFVQQQQRAAYKQVEMRNLSTGNKTNLRFATHESVERAMLENREMQYLFANTFMDMVNYEQVELSDDVIGENKVWLAPNMAVTIEFHNGQPITLILPEKIEGVIAQADQAIKGQTASSSYKPAVLENGVTVMVPPFINSGERIIVSTLDNSYVERAK